MASPIYNPIIPCVHPIPGGVYPGRMIRVQGNIPPGAQRFAINFQCGPNTDPRDDIAMHLNFRFVEMCVVRNHLTAMDWGVEDTAGGMPLTRGEAFEALILCEPQSFKVALNGVHFCEFLHRVPFQRISHITVDGDVHIQFIGFEGAQPPPQQMYMVNQYHTTPYRSEPPAYGAYGAPPPAYGAPGYGGPQQGYVPGAAVPAGYQQASYMAPQQQRRGIGTGAAVGMGVGALAAGGLAGYALGGGFSSDSPTTEMRPPGQPPYPSPGVLTPGPQQPPINQHEPNLPPQTVPVPRESIPSPLQPGPVPQESIPSSLQPGPVPQASIPSPLQLGAVPPVFIPTPLQPGPVPPVFIPTPLQPGPVPPVFIPTPLQPGLGPQESIPSPLQPGPVPQESIPSPLQPGPVPQEYIPSPPQPVPVDQESDTSTPPSSLVPIESDDVSQAGSDYSESSV